MLAARDADVEELELAPALVGDGEIDVAVDSLVASVPVEALSGSIPAEHRAVEPGREDRLVGRVEDRGEDLEAFEVARVSSLPSLRA